MEFLAVIGVIALFFFGKFIYDTYITDNTDKNWEKYQKNNPESAAGIEGNRGLNFNTQSIKNQNKKIASYVFIANNLNCAPEHVEAIYTTDLRKNISHSSQALEMAKNWQDEKHKQSEQLNIDPDDTPAGLLETWTMSVFNDLKRSENLSSKDEIEEEEDSEYEEDKEDGDIEEEDLDQNEDDDEDEIEINISGLHNIKINNSKKSDVINVYGLPDKEENHGSFSTEMIYYSQGLSFLYRANKKKQRIIGIKMARNFKKYFPLIKDSIDGNITLNTVMNAYGKVNIRTAGINSAGKWWVVIRYQPLVSFESEYSDYYTKNSALKLRIILIGIYSF
ncbi:hypothetical protein [Spirosoma areae]